MTFHRSVFGLLIALSLGAAFAQDKPEDCLRLEDQEGKRLPRLLGIAHRTVERICSGKNLKDQDIAPLLLDVATASNDEFKAIGLGEDLLAFNGQLAQARDTVAKSRAISPMRDIPNKVGIWFYDQVPVTDEARCDQIVKSAPRERVTAQTCKEFFEGYLAVYNYAQNAMQRRLAEPVELYIARMRKDWDDFLGKSRSQTPLELFINTWIWEKKDKAGVFLAPPAAQLILLHPSVVMERVGQGPDGSRTKEGVVLEVVGGNWWRRDEWYQPSGGSLVLVYSERAGMSAWRPGLAAHFGNKYTIGVTSNAGQRGLFFSLDVLELAKDKKLMGGKYDGNVLDFLQ
jgi:hypothetical protein